MSLRSPNNPPKELVHFHVCIHCLSAFRREVFEGRLSLPEYFLAHNAVFSKRSHRDSVARDSLCGGSWKERQSSMYAYDAKCLDQVARTMKVLRGKWTVQVLCALLDGPVRLSQPRNLFRTEYCRQLPGALGKRNLIQQVGAPKGLDEEKPQSRTSALDSTRRQLPIAKQVHLLLANMAWTKALRRTMEVLRKILHRVDGATDSAWGVVATLEFIQHQLPKMGHGESPVTRGLHSQQCPGKANTAASVAPAT